ncbi:transaldolase [Psychromonas sp. 14N.309.X.WAT.B.A12]|uniref:transaldolase n=1 Tax=Psychromonas sp. 14N.309.X.WAT.B.A12 TaxID=2998322 RepID=UPI0025B1E826|nr:transaldolase [Psychromonas sp. 14N.309.X.WAT.B.A12]MDN2664294.1 transaldolase [Psychromonas sp. 14N.309.X.WAT.B.A12]
MSNQLIQLKQMSTVVADTGDVQAIAKYQPQDATTNPSLLLKAASLPQYQELLTQATEWAKQQSQDAQQQVIDASDKLSVLVGLEILKTIPGRISTEVDSRLSFDTQGSIVKARKLITLYNQAGITNDRILIKLAATWEGIKAAEILEKEGINCNLTLLFSFAQAQACAEANVYLISPFVGRILDWYKKQTGKASYPADQDPGVISVTNIYNYYKQQGYQTVVMGASFRSVEEVLALAGCDRLTISPDLMAELQNSDAPIEQKLKEQNTPKQQVTPLTESEFRWSLNEDAMATEKLAEGIRNFTLDQIKLDEQLTNLLTA